MKELPEVLRLLEAEEPDYQSAKLLGNDVLPQLVELANTAEPLMASKAVNLAARIGTPEALEVVARASHREEPKVRVAAAAAIGELDADAAKELERAVELTSTILIALLNDEDAGVRKFAERSAQIRSDLNILEADA